MQALNATIAQLNSLINQHQSTINAQNSQISILVASIVVIAIVAGIAIYLVRKQYASFTFFYLFSLSAQGELYYELALMQYRIYRMNCILRVVVLDYVLKLPSPILPIPSDSIVILTASLSSLSLTSAFLRNGILSVIASLSSSKVCILCILFHLLKV